LLEGDACAAGQRYESRPRCQSLQLSRKVRIALLNVSGRRRVGRRADLRGWRGGRFYLRGCLLRTFRAHAEPLIDKLSRLWRKLFKSQSAVQARAVDPD